MMKTVTPSPRPGEILDGKYRVEAMIGEGGMGYVLLATHLQLEERVALKLLLPKAAADPVVVERFLREARAVRRIRGEHVARVYDIGETESGAPYIAMEYLEGADLAKTLSQRGRLPIAEAIDYVLQACEAVAAAHALRIVHRDLKPSNLFLTRGENGSPRVKVLDFGVSKMSLGESDMSMTHTSAVLGTPRYMSPEQLVSARAVDVRSDIWALGVIVFELMTGEQPFLANNVLELGAVVLTSPPRNLRTVEPACPIGLAAAVDRCLAKDPNERFQTIADLADALAPFGDAHARDVAARVAATLHGSRGTSSGQLGGSTTPIDGRAVVEGRPRGYVPSPLESAPTVNAPGLARPAMASGPSPAIAAVVGVVLVGSIGVVVAWTSHARTPDRAPTSSSSIASAAESVAPLASAAPSDAPTAPEPPPPPKSATRPSSHGVASAPRPKPHVPTLPKSAPEPAPTVPDRHAF
jgi:eukaryotic-like serine/threonine-protein kinase